MKSREIVVDLVAHRRVSAGEWSADLRGGDLRDCLSKGEPWVLNNLHADVWWGGLLVVLGARFLPARERARMAGDS